MRLSLLFQTKGYLGLLLLLLGVALGLSSCEKDITVDLPDAELKVVVEGSIEPGLPPIVVLTKSAPFFGEFDLNDLSGFFVRGAEVRISDGTTTAELIELCLGDLPPEFLPIAADLFGFDPDSLVATGADFCVYTIDFLGGVPMLGVPGRRYDLTAVVEGDTIRASSTMQQPIATDSLWWTPHPNPEADSLVRLNLQITDPDTLGNHYRYWTARSNAEKGEDEPLFPGVASVIDDLLFNGQQVQISVDRGQPRSAGFDLDTYGFFWKGDTIVFKLAQIGRQEFDFWTTLEFDAGSGGPFSSATVVDGNVEGALGVFAAYGSVYDTLIVE
jgi:hypothetical protein